MRVVFVGHADPAVQLDVGVCVGDAPPDWRDAWRHRGVRRASVAPFLERGRGIPQLAPRRLHADRHVGARVADRLLGADLAPEGFAHLGVLDDLVERRLGDPDLHRGDPELAHLPDTRSLDGSDRFADLADEGHRGRRIE